MGAWAGFELPALDVVDGVTEVRRVPGTLIAVYHDTPDLRLVRWGVTVRHRSGEQAPVGLLAAALAGVQTVLGEHPDAVVAEGWLRSAVEGADPAVGELMAVQRVEAAACRKRWKKAWHRASDQKLRSWL